QALEDGEHLLDAAHLAAAHQLPRLVQYADRDTFGMDIESYVVHNDLHKSGYARTQTTYLYVTRLTEAPFIVSRLRAHRNSANLLRADRPKGRTAQTGLGQPLDTRAARTVGTRAILAKMWEVWKRRSGKNTGNTAPFRFATPNGVQARYRSGA